MSASAPPRSNTLIAGGLPWIERAPGAPYFITAAGEPWTPIGQNDALPWPELSGLLGRRDLPEVERHLRALKESGVTCLRLMLEYAEGEEHYFERPAGNFVPAVVELWDDLFALCERVGLYILLTPMDTFFTWIRFDRHPYNRAHGGPCADRSQLMVCPETRALVKARLAFATERWGGSGALFAWDLWNEMHPAQGDNRPDAFPNYIDDVSPFLRELEIRLHGRAHLQCVSVFGPELIWKPWIVEPIFRHPLLDFANSHFYEEGTIDDPMDTVAPAVSAGRLTREALSEINDMRPFFDSEHGPIHTFKDHGITLPAAYDDEYFRHIQWAHLASGGAGGGMRWPNRDPHVLTPGMRAAQGALSRFLPLIDWPRFLRRNLNDEIAVESGAVHAFGCGDASQAVVWLLRQELGEAVEGRRPVKASGTVQASIRVPGLAPGRYRVTLFDTLAGREAGQMEATADDAGLRLTPTIAAGDLALAIVPA
ncbi:hypothetical protein [Roseomonas indoligenes]|uniref:Uncharacterized protein n=1 Tax=Roseomonas indoligenes TaxID=2820811 RepID=A0A940MP77_9PROT|nr:hypothetical protein [Pararoseomonas indoligenes]MBP0491418.1 hypothetical protein [Pararoseomonas indoligenes]